LYEDLRRRAAHGFVSPIAFSMIHCGLVEQEQALDAIEDGIRHRCPGFPVFLSGPLYDVMRRHPRFVQLVEEIGWPSLAHLADAAMRP